LSVASSVAKTTLKAMIGIILPTRGMVFTEVEDSISRNLDKYNYKTYRSFDLEIPECQNVLVDKALADGCKNLLFIEEDTVLPDGALELMLEADSDIACVDYSVAGYSCITRSKDTNDILWCGLGCTLVKAEVFVKLEKPYFRSDKALLLNDWPNLTWIDAGKQAYGGQDIYFCMQARDKGFKIKQVAGECKHLKLEALGKREINKGLHIILEKPRISKKQTL
jgi:hypothetical protein